MGWLIAAALLLLALLWTATRLRRRSIRTLLLATGVQTSGTSSLHRRGPRTPRIAVRYTDNSGTERVVVKALVSAGDAELLKKPAVVLYHPKRASRSDYVLVGFGQQPRTWFPVEFAPSTKADPVRE
ncbi:hypothetical protein GCM10009655_05750 [Rhodoglobus aureus]|uniref:DUF3592 domain-containing protein n=1 Tax=Rhodoglobus aureus TaxID=191497 RepID=A0ABN1VFS3_9MICO